MQQPIYALKALIIKKYGKEKYHLGCILVSQWLMHCKQAYWEEEDIRKMCYTTDYNFSLLPIEAEQLRKLFGLQSIEELYTNHSPPSTDFIAFPIISAEIIDSDNPDLGFSVFSNKEKSQTSEDY